MENFLTNMSPDSTPPWVMSARHFIGTGEDHFMNDAIEQCDDTATKAFLVMIAGSQEQEGHMPEPQDFQRLANDILTTLMAESRIGEAGVVELLVRRSTVRLITLNIHAKAGVSDEVQRSINFAFNRGIELSQNLHFMECEAFFATALGDHEMSLGNWEAGCGTHGHSLYLYSEVTSQILNAADSSHLLKVAYIRAGLEVMLHAAISNGKAGHEKLAFDLLERTTNSYRHLRAKGGVRRETAFGAFSTFTELARIRQLRAASILGDLALEMYRDLCESDPGPQQTYDLALCASEVGQFHAKLSNVQRSLPLCTEGVHLMQGLVGEHPWFFQGPLGMAYGALANAYRVAGQSAQALSCFKQSVSWLRRASGQHDDPNRIQHLPHLIDALNNYGSACRDGGNQEQAIKAYEEAVAMITDLRATTPYVLPREWMIYGNLCLLFASEDRLDEAWALGERAMVLLESDEVPDHERWLEKGLATKLYIHMFERYVRAGKTSRAFRCLIALRTAGRVLSTEGASDALRESLQHIATLSREQAKPVTILCPQTLYGSGMMMAILRSDADLIEFVDCSTFVEPAFDLWKQAITSRSENDGQDYLAVCTAAAERAWSFLPVVIQRLLAPTDGGQTLICGDDNWTSFPWEVLKFGPSSLDLLGLRYLLPRWHSPDATTLASIANETIDGCFSESAVVCPWNATNIELEGARREAVAVAKMLASYANPSAVQSLLLGEAATAQAMADIVTRAPDIIHYAGHGSVSNGEEVLLLYDTEQPALFGSRELRAAFLRSTATPGRERRGRLVVLNCCYGGTVRSFGGHREDLASAFLRSGVSSVVASATPLVDESAGIFGVCLHHRFVADEETLSNIVLRARRLVARCMQALGQHSWATWCAIVYHGSPFVTYRRSELSHEREGDGLASSVATFLASVVALDRSQQLMVARVFEEVLRNELDAAD